MAQRFSGIKPPRFRFAAMRDLFFLAALLSFFPVSNFAQTDPVVSQSGAVEEAEPQPNLFAEAFYMKPDDRLALGIFDVKGFSFVERQNRELNSRYAAVTDFAPGIVKSRTVPNIKDLNGLRKWVKDNAKSALFKNVEIRRLTFKAPSGSDENVYWVGQQSYLSADDAKSRIEGIRNLVESRGESFPTMVQQAQIYVPLEEPEPDEVPRAQFEKEESLMLKYLDQLDIGEKAFGPFQGEGAGEPIIWQSFGETTWRNTNFSDHNFNNQVGFWTNRLVFKGIRFPWDTINAYVEETTTMEAVSDDSKSFMKLFAGLEWRPLARNPWVQNFRPWSLPLLDFVRNYRFYVQYGDRKNIKDEILNSASHDLIWGVQIFYEWGIDLPAAGEGLPVTVPDYVREYVWGEYFGDYRFEMTNFGAEDDFDAFIFNSAVLLGVRLPGIPLPPNPINDEFVLMPYLKFEHVNNTDFSFPFQNRYFMGAGVRWMPFRNYRFKENEWLSKTKVFFEYDGIGKAQNAKQDGEAPHAVRYDFRVGVNFSSRRF